MSDLQPALPFESQTAEVVLTADQIEVLQPLLVLQRCHDKSVIFSTFAQSYDYLAHKGILRLQFKVCDRRSSARALAILRKSTLENS